MADRQTLTSFKQLEGKPTWWRGALIYQIYVRSYKDSTGNGIGDLRGIIDQLTYLEWLGVDAIWITPFFKSPMKDYGYDVSDYCDVDPLFGSLDDFDELLEQAHSRNIRVMIDLVLSHTADTHDWFAESRQSKDNSKSDWYVWADPKPDGTVPTNWLSIFGGSAWQWDTRRRQYYLHNFLESQADLNFHNPDVQDALLDVVRFWLDKGVDGFRLDTVNMYFHDDQLRDNPPITVGEPVNGIPDSNPYAMQNPLYNITRPENLAFLERLRAVLDEYPNVTSLGELGAVTDMYSRIAEYTEAGKRIHMAYSFDFMTEEYSAAHIRSVIERMEAGIKGGWSCWAFTNHDVERAVSRWQQVPEAAPMLSALLMSLPGTPCMYQGEELGLPEAELTFEQLQDPYGIAFWPEFKGRDGCRTPIPWTSDSEQAGFTEHMDTWLPIPEAHRQLAANTQRGQSGSALNHVQQFIQWRKDYPVFYEATINFIDVAEPCLAFTLTANQEDEDKAMVMLCVFNLDSQAQTCDLAALEIDTNDIQALDGHGFTVLNRQGNNITLTGYSAYYALVSMAE